MYNSINDSNSSNRYDIINQVFKLFGILWIVTGLGLILGQFLPNWISLPIGFLTLGILIVTSFMKVNKKLGIKVSIIIAFLIGISLNSIVTHYIGMLGNSVVLAVFGTTAIVFGVTGFIGMKTKKDLMGWGNILFISLIVLVIFSLISIFVPFSNTLVLILSGVGVLLFSLFNVYEMNKLAKGHVSEEEVGFAALNLYLNFVNIFLDLLRIAGILSED